MRHREACLAARPLVIAVCVAPWLACRPASVALPSAPGLTTVVDTAFYDVSGRERRQWMSSMRAGARRAGVPGPFVAYTRSQTHWKYSTSRPGTGGCQPGAPSVEVRIRYIVPRLSADTVEEEDLLEWRRYITSL